MHLDSLCMHVCMGVFSVIPSVSSSKPVSYLLWKQPLVLPTFPTPFLTPLFSCSLRNPSGSSFLTGKDPTAHLPNTLFYTLKFPVLSFPRSQYQSGKSPKLNQPNYPFSWLDLFAYVFAITHEKQKQINPFSTLHFLLLTVKSLDSSHPAWVQIPALPFASYENWISFLSCKMGVVTVSTS